MKMIKGYATIPLPLDYPVRNMDDWLKIKHHYAFSEERLAGDPDWEAIRLFPATEDDVKRLQERGKR